MLALIAVVVVTVVLAAGVAAVPAARRSDGRTADVLRWVAPLLAALGGAVLIRDTWLDATPFVYAALGLPVVVLLVPVLLARSRWVRLASTAAATAVLAWAVVWGLGGGLVLLPAVIVEFVAAALTPWRRTLAAR
ncbi:hypothetical protein [Modestobacter roseus]|uniref:Uncharacterized protein n=1 Tax=Modestobacter roseus TaxID=1181884 RepID=A0A562ITY8_9ACTN|nr:hypothetical protein [Modestobacter roseus]MQA35266.1 hypothetical protein [Modestobacter roseus]TWH74135.1 hypothetical protein JD78_02670 [Modestobacter roseus]